MKIPGTVIVTEKQADLFELEKMRTKLVNLEAKYHVAGNQLEATIFRLDLLINELRKDSEL